MQSALLGAIVGALAGGIATYLGQWWLVAKGEDRINKAAARSVYLELSSNHAYVEKAIEAPPAERLTRTAWETLQPRIAMLMKADELSVVAEPYLRQAMYERWCEERERPGPHRDETNFAIGHHMLDCLAIAADALGNYAWSAAEAEAIHQRHQEASSRADDIHRHALEG